MLKPVLVAFLISCSSLAFSAPPASAGVAGDEAVAAVHALDKLSASLESGDRASADAALNEAQKQLAALAKSASDAQHDADSRGRFCETKSTEVTDAIARKYAKQTKNEALLRDLDFKLAGNAARATQLDAELADLAKKQQVFVEEANFRKRCADDGWFYFKTGRCWELGFRDLFENRVTNINRQAADRRETRKKLNLEAITLGREATGLRGEHARLGREIEALKQARTGLNAKSGELRKAATEFSSLAQFWGEVQVDATGRSLNQVKLAILTLSFDKDLLTVGPTERRQVEEAREALMEFRDYRSRLALAGGASLSCN